MTLGAPIALPWRCRPVSNSSICSLAKEYALDDFLSDSPLGRLLANGWHVRMEFVRRWGHIREFDSLPRVALELDDQQLSWLLHWLVCDLAGALRFIRWVKPVEEQVRDDPGTLSR